MTVWLITALALVSFLALILLWVLISDHSVRRQRQADEAQADRESRRILGELEANRYRLYGGVQGRVDTNGRFFSLTISNQHSSRQFPVDLVAGGWKVFTYDKNGDRRLMPPETFEMHVLEVRDWSKQVREEAGFTNTTSSSPAVPDPSEHSS